MTISSSPTPNPSLKANPDLDTWIRVDESSTITVSTGKAELGQGLARALARIAAEELDVDPGRIVVRTADTGRGPDEGITAGSLSMAHSGTAIRQAAAEARAQLLLLAASRLRVEATELRVDDGTFAAPDGKTVTYWELSGGRPFGVTVTGTAPTKAPTAYTLVGRSGPSSEVRDLVTGAARFVHDLAPSGLVHARVLQPPSPAARLVELDESPAASLSGVVAIVHDGGFVGLVAEREEQAMTGIEALGRSARWLEERSLPSGSDLGAWLRSQPVQSYLIVDGAPVEGPVPDAAPAETAAVTVEGTYTRPYQMHASIGPSAALAEWADGLLTVWTHSQSVSLLRVALAQALGLDPAEVRAIHFRGPGCYGHNGSDDAAYEACLLALSLPGRPILLKWTREDEHANEPYAPPAVVSTRASVDDAGALVDWDLEAWGTTHHSRPFPYGEHTGFAAAWRLAAPVPRQPLVPLLIPEAGIHRNATPGYRVPARRIVKHFVANAPLRTSSTRALGAFANVFAIESTLDELAYAIDADPVQFRLDHLDDERAREVIVAAADRFGWATRTTEFGRGSGLGYARYKNSAAYAAVFVEVEVDDETAELSVLRAVIAADAGQVVDPSGLANQLEGGLVQSLSWTLLEQVAFDETRVTSTDWETYPILTFPSVPPIETVLLDRPGAPFLGAGEATAGPTVAAVGNAVREALGIRLYDLPFTADRIRAAVAAS